ncbi:MAG TPA: hypothetical protein ENI90_00730 [Methylothermaceae bacterium]|nr:hypothetical protein [Methylothermaceae bacterium]
MLIAVTVVSILVAPKDFMWSVFSLAAVDAQRSLSAGVLQTVGGISLNPLLPYAQLPVAILLTQFGFVGLLSFVVLRNGFLRRRPAQSLILAYIGFLSINVLLYDYYWVAPLLMTLTIVLGRTELSPHNGAHMQVTGFDKL